MLLQGVKGTDYNSSLWSHATITGLEFCSVLSLSLSGLDHSTMATNFKLASNLASSYFPFLFPFKQWLQFPFNPRRESWRFQFFSLDRRRLSQKRTDGLSWLQFWPHLFLSSPLAFPFLKRKGKQGLQNPYNSNASSTSRNCKKETSSTPMVLLFLGRLWCVRSGLCLWNNIRVSNQQ